MIYAVKNEFGTYDMYRGPRPWRRRPRQTMVVSLEEILPVVPSGSVYVGTEDGPVGQIGQLGADPTTSSSTAPSSSSTKAPSPEDLAPTAKKLWDNPAVMAGALFLGTYVFYRVVDGLAKAMMEVV